KDVPSRFDDTSTLAREVWKKPLKRFPVLPPEHHVDALPELDLGEPGLNQSFDVFQAARAWYRYAQEPLPPPTRNPMKEDEFYNPVQHRLPKMAIYIFRAYPARALVYVADTLKEEGWFDRDGWEIANWFEDAKGRPRTVNVGGETKYWSGLAWE